ncbi:diacylglycerol kinase family protein [Streptacidiphilus sp. N1-12]|uniref:Diacylglycerol kinase family protein n=2 Tax=Streptacidiphilus alkalitolerans TaxID=3342712 RepID=A0ABV6WDJ2_9ACTN
MSAARSAGEPVLVVVSPAALALDGESVRVARDVLGAAFEVKLVVPRSLDELERTLSRRGGRRLVLIGDDHALHQVVQLLHEQSGLSSGPVGIIPVGKGEKVVLARSLGAAGRPVDAARAVVSGCVRSLGLLVDESGGVVLGGLRIPGRGGPGQGLGAAAEPGRGGAPGARPTAGTGRSGVPPQLRGPAAERSLRANKAAAGRGVPLPSACREWGTQLGRAARTVAAQLLPARSGPGQALLVEADGRLLADLEHPIQLVAAWNAGTRGGAGGCAADGDSGLMEILVSAASLSGGPQRLRARRITVTGGPSTSFTYEADDSPGGPVQQRTWTVEPAAWGLTVPPAA